MASRIGRFPAIAILVWIGSGSAQAASYAKVMCLNAMDSGLGFADCFQSQHFGSASGVDVIGLGEAHADLSTGVMRSRSQAEGERSPDTPDAAGANGGSTAWLADTITVGGGYSGPVQLQMKVSGTFRMNNLPFGSLPYGSRGADAIFPTVTPQLFLWDKDPSNPPESSAAAFVEQYSDQFLVHLESSSTQGGGSVDANTDSSGNFADPADVQIMLTGTFDVTPSNPTFSFSAVLGTSTGINAAALPPGEYRLSEVDFGNSAHLSLILPAGVPWTSESGVFLQGVPEPGTGVLLAAGMLCLSTVRPGRGAIALSRLETKSL
jgi:hypothetical protein